MKNQPDKYREIWRQRLMKVRRGYSFQRWADSEGEINLSIKELFRWIFDDIFYLVIWNVNLLLQLRGYGSAIKDKYGLSYFKQWYRMAYLVFVMRTDSKNFRVYHLFRPERWKHVDDFTYGQLNDVSDQLLGSYFKGDLEILADKLQFFRFCTEHGISTPAILAVFDKGEIIYASEKPFRIPQSDLFIKEHTGGSGRGAKKLHYSDSTYRDNSGKLFSPDKLYGYLEDYSRKKAGILLQNAVKNHDSWKKFSNGSLATCRVVTAKSFPGGSIIPLFCSLRMPVGKLDADNYSLGGMVATVSLETGEIGQAICSKPVQGMFLFDAHPDSGQKITGEILPSWKELLTFTASIHEKFDTIFVGWDVSLTEEGFQIIEGNSKWATNVIEGPGNVPLFNTAYPELFEKWVEELSGKHSNKVR